MDHFRTAAPLVLFVLASLLFFTRLSAPLLEPDEARYAEIPRQMLARGHFLEPILNGQPYYHKPPLLYWLVMGSYRIFGVHDWAARVTPGCAGVLIVLLVYWWGRQPLGERAAFLAALILCLSARFLYLGRMLTMDIVLCLWVIAGLLAAFRAIGQETFRWGWWLAAALACGLGIMTKGPVAMVLIAVPVMLFQLLIRSAARATWRRWCGFFGLSVAVAAPWFVSLAVCNWQAFVDFFWIHHIRRFADPIDHAKPIWFFLPSLFLGMLPWSLLLLPLFRFLFRRNPRATKRTPGLTFFAIAAFWCIAFYSLSGCKRAVYILPALPLLALTLGCYLASAWDWQSIRWRNLLVVPVPVNKRACAHFVTIGTLLGGITLSLVAAGVGLWDSTKALLIGALFAGLLGVAVYYLGHPSAVRRWASCLAALFFLLWLSVCELLPDYNRRFALRGHVRRHQGICAREDLTVICYPRQWNSVAFYLQTDDVHSFSHGDLKQLQDFVQRQRHCLVFVKRGEYLRRFCKALPESLEFIPHRRQRNRLVVGLVRPSKRGHHTLVVERRH